MLRIIAGVRWQQFLVLCWFGSTVISGAPEYVPHNRVTAVPGDAASSTIFKNFLSGLRVAIWSYCVSFRGTHCHVSHFCFFLEPNGRPSAPELSQLVRASFPKCVLWGNSSNHVRLWLKVLATQKGIESSFHWALNKLVWRLHCVSTKGWWNMRRTESREREEVAINQLLPLLLGRSSRVTEGGEG